ncbi:MAG: oxygenase MpaB family protein, partial [Actinomycetota bacterium]|nr:oxygenase MpaB family protein [Actinomycetota bacterium]
MSAGTFRGPGTGEVPPGVHGVVASFRSLFPPAPAPGVPGDPGLFGPASTAWSVLRERVVLLGGPAALLLQVAHPLVAAGVAEHSDFRADPLHRLRATLDATLT